MTCRHDFIFESRIVKCIKCGQSWPYHGEVAESDLPRELRGQPRGPFGTLAPPPPPRPPRPGCEEVQKKCDNCGEFGECCQIQPAQKMDWHEMLRLIKTIKYLRGIAERGLDREMRDDETLEQFVLGYVKQLETQPQQEPVKVGRITDNIKGMVLRQEVMLYTDDYLPIGTAIYTSQPQRRPLMDEQKDAARYRFLRNYAHMEQAQNAWRSAMTNRAEAMDEYIDRAIEAAHGIKGDA